MTPAIQQLLFRLGIALALGLLIGLERGWEGRELAEGRRAAGFRTFGIISLLGGVSELLAENGDWMLMPALVIALGTFMSLGYWRTSAADNDLSVTTAVTALLTFALGAVAVRGHLVVASSATVVVVLILSIKPELHEMVRHIERSELLATIRLLLISVVLLPILPDRDYGPWHAVNPYR
ncbi:MAG TPA: MgtC/SapB family protein, partial [Candidatus Binataceae bacterium]